MQVAHAHLTMSCIHQALLHLQLQGKMWAYRYHADPLWGLVVNSSNSGDNTIKMTNPFCHFNRIVTRFTITDLLSITSGVPHHCRAFKGAR